MKKMFQGKQEFSETNDDEKMDESNFLNKDFYILNHVIKIFKKKNLFRIWGVLLIKDKRKDESKKVLNEPKILIGQFQYPFDILARIIIGKNLKIMLYRFEVKYTDIIKSGFHTPLYITASDDRGVGYKKRLKYIGFMPTKPSILWHGPIKNFKETNISVFLRQGSKNFLYATAPEIKITSRLTQKIKISLAFFISRIFFFIKTVVLFEKHSSEYQASASVMFEKLIDEDYKRVYFILDKKFLNKYKISNKYKRNIVWKYSFKHYLVFFMSKLYLSSESIYHATELRTINRFIHFHVLSTKEKIPYIFLQHGVMYMVRLDAKYRWGFRYGRMFKENSRIVVSSKLEAQHFIDYGNFPKDNLYITGLAQWDRIEYNSLSKEADKIMIIPTWRHWELSEARVTPQNTGYYKLMERIVSNIPKKFKHQILLVPHPLFIDFFKDTDLNEFIPKDYMNWISLLNQTKVLITDYSSFSYLAFYKGCNVIFDWSDLDECMKVGYDGALMLNKDNAFGDIIYNEKDKLPTLIKNNIDGDRKDEYIKNFNQIIEFRDGNNADRILDMIKKDGFL